MPDKKIAGKNIGIVLLAAGESSRLGRPKQLLPYEKQTLLQRCLQIAKASDGNPIVVVLGAGAEMIKKEIGSVDAHVIVNNNWQEGMASSIRSGIKELERISPNAEGVVLMICDQPFVSASLMNSLIGAHRGSGKPIIASGYDNTFGPPVLFHKTLFHELLQLKGDVGAKGVISKHADEVEVVSFPEGSMDIDTDADYEKFQKMRESYDKRQV